MRYNEFFDKVTESIKEFLPDEYSGSEVTVMEATKNNMTLHGLAIRPEGVEAVPFIYLEQYCDRYNSGEKMEDLMQEIADTFTEYIGKSSEMELPELDYDSVCEYLRVRLVNTKKNADMLKDCVNRPVSCGFSLAVYIDLEKMTGYPGIIQVTRDVAENIGCDEKVLFAKAIENSVEKTPAVLWSIEDVIYMGAPGWEKMDLLKDGQADPEDGMFVLTNEGGENGAAALFYPGVQEKISEIAGGNYYVIPSSIHEVIIIRDDIGLEPDMLVKMVRDVNKYQVAPVERLADRVLHYRSDIQLLEVAADLEKDRSKGKER